MLTLITGLPGNGKTLYALQYVFDWVKKETTVEHPAPRQVYYHAINGLKPELGWLKLETSSEYIDGEKNPPVDVPQWWMCPPRSIIIIDEAQNCGFGVRQRGQSPEWSRKLETHRHMGLDLVFITQDPGLIDAHDRKLMELHFHVMRTFGMQRAVIHEFRPVRSNVLTNRKGSIEHRWSYPKTVFAWYTSAEAHTHKRRIPMKVLVFLTLPFLIVGLSWFAWSRYLSPNRDSLKAAQAAASASGGGIRPGMKLTAAEYVKQYQPRIKGLEYTAPIYDEVTKPIEAPYPAACVSSKAHGCQCYTQQGTRLHSADDLCREFVETGFFVAWKLKEPVHVEKPHYELAEREQRNAVAGSFGVAPPAPAPADGSGSVLDFSDSEQRLGHVKHGASGPA